MDERLWVEVDAIPGRCFPIGNAHTHRGRMQAWSEDLGRNISFSKHQVTDASELARVWIDGFLAGNGPEASAMFGPGIWDAPDEDPRWQRYYDALAAFRKTGNWAPQPWRKLTPFPPNTAPMRDLWTVRGDEVWTWDVEAEEWALATSHPVVWGTFLNDSVCERRKHHDLSVVTPVHLVCDECGWTTESLR